MKEEESKDKRKTQGREVEPRRRRKKEDSGAKRKIQERVEPRGRRKE